MTVALSDMTTENSNSNSSSQATPETSSGGATLYPGSFRDIDEVVESCWQQIKKDIRRRGFASEEIKIHMALAEAIINAWKHGNQRSNSQPIIFRWRFNGDFTFEVCNRGPGFNYRQELDPTRGPQLTAENGRGLFIIKTLARSIKWRDQGRHLTVTFSPP